MAVPKRKTSPSRRGMRRSADALARPTYVEDKDSGELRRPHHIDLKTGMYRGRQVLNAKKEGGLSLNRVARKAIVARRKLSAGEFCKCCVKKANWHVPDRFPPAAHLVCVLR